MGAERSRRLTFALSEAERLNIYRLRYRIYVEEMGKPYPSADDTLRLLTDQLDATAVLIYLTGDHGDVIGTLRCNRASDVLDCTPLASCLQLADIPSAILPQVTVCSRLVLTRSQRNRVNFWRLVRAIYRWGLEHDIQLNLIHTNEALVPLFTRLGFRPFGDPFLDAQAGTRQQALYLLLHDSDHLQRVISPFLSELSAFQDSSNSHHGLSTIRAQAMTSHGDHSPTPRYIRQCLSMNV